MYMFDNPFKTRVLCVISLILTKIIQLFGKKVSIVERSSNCSLGMSQESVVMQKECDGPTSPKGELEGIGGTPAYLAPGLNT